MSRTIRLRGRPRRKTGHELQAKLNLVFARGDNAAAYAILRAIVIRNRKVGR